MTRLWFQKKWLCAGGIAALLLAMAWVGVRSHGRTEPGKIADTVGLISQPAASLPQNLNQVPRSTQVDVPIAAIGQDSPNASDSTLLGIADVRPSDSFQAAESAPAGAGDNQSDAEQFGMQAEPSHTVAPVPMHDAAAAAADARLASLGVAGVNGDRRVFIMTAATVDGPGWADSRWPLVQQLELHWTLGRELFREHQYHQSGDELVTVLRDIARSAIQVAGPMI